VSVEATSWALNLGPVPAGRGGQPSSAREFVLVGLANHAGPDGTGALPSAATLVHYTGLSKRTVRTGMNVLAAEGWDWNLSLVRDDLDSAALAVLDSQFLGLAAS